MARWTIRYTDACGELSSVWVEAETAEGAIDNAYREYWEIEDILVVRRGQ